MYSSVAVKNCLLKREGRESASNFPFFRATNMSGVSGHLFSRARRLFAYGNLDGASNANSTTTTTNMPAPAGASGVTIEENVDMAQVSQKRLARRRKLVAAVALLGVTILVIVAMTTKQRSVENVQLKVDDAEMKEAMLERSGKKFSEIFGNDLVGGGGEEDITLNDIVLGKFYPRNAYKVRFVAVAAATAVVIDVVVAAAVSAAAPVDNLVFSLLLLLLLLFFLQKYSQRRNLIRTETNCHCFVL